MPTRTGHESHRTGAIASTVTALNMPFLEVSERTQATYTIGALHFVQHLMEGDLNVLHEPDMKWMVEFLRRAIENATHSGISVSELVAIEVDVQPRLINPEDLL